MHSIWINWTIESQCFCFVWFFFLLFIRSRTVRNIFLSAQFLFLNCSLLVSDWLNDSEHIHIIGTIELGSGSFFPCICCYCHWFLLTCCCCCFLLLCSKSKFILKTKVCSFPSSSSIRSALVFFFSRGKVALCRQTRALGMRFICVYTK